MVLESTIVCVDNSEWMRNGDFPPSRLDAQQDAANLLATIKLQSNPENTVGVLTTAGASSRILITSTQDSGKILTCLRSVAPTGSADVVAAMQKAQLALKHRQNQAQRQRIVLFVGSPIAAEEAVLVSLGKKLKKNAVAVDVINFGESVENEAKLNAFISAVNVDENSHLLSVASGTAILADAIMPSPIDAEADMLVQALAASNEEAQQGEGGEEDMDEDLRRAIELSKEDYDGGGAGSDGAGGSGGAGDKPDGSSGNA
ncbi:hypothetical protein I4F81_000176 [Pyropia yezoensis]|uniref:Uncharacterized protein n=1 Tax=Pyropia yezoensis TaxID=2788 RepID=A0ACC3BID2_PYRYE|nr:hypothetical protein I4F81_000176 [Neopyropia yezoensis]